LAESAFCARLLQFDNAAPQNTELGLIVAMQQIVIGADFT
jgi:hypothetical protein